MMSSEWPPAKRQRTENAPITSRPVTLWIEDGNVVLAVGNTQFRVHWSTLARHSPFFRHMQGLPQPGDEPNIDGCPVVQLSDDPTDVEYLLSSLYNPTFLLQQRLPLRCIGALIRLGRKYDFKGLLDFATDRLTAEFPATLAEYDAMRATFETIDWYYGIDLDVITLLSENNIFRSLPSACYRTVEMNTLGDLLDGIDKIDGTCASLSQTDLRRCAVGQQTLLRKQFQSGNTLGWARRWEFYDCTSPVVCRMTREHFLETYMEDSEILAFMKPLLSGGHRFKFCAACTRHATESIAAGREKMWNELPGIFDLPPWNALKNDL
ncbi:hypothetical protein C8R45DRAFT_885281 [Mycena sanguinolenta]|nr:hypothetical protein C8R45DRAFT_885281 [Mycena sanguinolenta]